ncbi:MAG: hypothetical protein KAT13_06390 [Methanosarcinales archaeon]|nr:hypothetical protein [Methanosarcinales archaeon]
MKKRTSYGFSALMILGILILSNTASACVNPTDSFATEVLLNKPGVSYNLSGMIGSDDVIVKTKEVPILETGHTERVPTPQAIMIPENNSTVITETVMPKLPAETRTELDRIIYRSHYNPDVAVILSEDSIYTEGEWDDTKHISVKTQIPTKDVHKSMPYIGIGLVGDVNAATLDIDASADLGWDFEVSGSGSWTTEDGERRTMKIYSLRKGDIQIEVMPAERTSQEETEVCVAVNDATSLGEGAKDEITDVLVTIGFFESIDIIDDTAIISNIREWDDLESAIGVAADDFNFGAAMKTELEHLRGVGVIVGLTDTDVDEIASVSVRGTAGYNSRIVYEGGEWITYRETGNPVLMKLGDCGGFSITELPGETASSAPTESTTHAPAPDHAPAHTVPAFTAFAAIAGLLAVVRGRRRRK